MKATIHHPFWVVEGIDLANRSRPRELVVDENEGRALAGRWVNSHELCVGDWLIGREGKLVQIRAISQQSVVGIPVCNLTIEHDHNYAVGSKQLLVHNTSICDDAVEQAKNSGKSLDELRAEFVATGKYTPEAIEDALRKIADPNWVSELGRTLRVDAPKSMHVGDAGHHVEMPTFF